MHSSTEEARPTKSHSSNPRESVLYLKAPMQPVRLHVLRQIRLPRWLSLLEATGLQYAPDRNRRDWNTFLTELGSDISARFFAGRISRGVAS